MLSEVDCGGARAGLSPTGPELPELAGVLDASEGVELAGVLTHAGQSYGCRNVAEVKAVAATVEVPAGTDPDDVATLVQKETKRSGISGCAANSSAFSRRKS